MRASTFSSRVTSTSGIAKCIGTALTISMLSGCSLFGSGEEPKPVQPATKQSLMIDTSKAAREAAEKYPKQVGEQVCRNLENKLWGEFVMVGRVGAIGEDYLMRVDLLRVQMKGHKNVTQRGFKPTRWALQNQWYSCQDPV